MSLYEVTVETIVRERYLVDAESAEAASEYCVVKGDVLSSEVVDEYVLAAVPSQSVRWTPKQQRPTGAPQSR